MVYFKQGVVPYKLHPAIEALLADGGELDEVYYMFSGRPCIVTSARDGRHSRKSLHYKGKALDLRTNDIDRVRTQKIYRELKRRLDRAYDVLLEYVGTPNEHIHIEYDPH